jgi:uncharacterized protein YgfB (UPF0149 family)
MDVIVNKADTDQEWVRAFLLRLGYHLAAEWQFMPECELRDLIAEHANDLIDMADPPGDDPPPPTLRAV